MTDSEDSEGGHRDEDREHDKGHDRKIEVLVNERPVILNGSEQTGLSIKEAAIAQDAGIQLDFVLSIERGGGKTELIGDNDHIRVHPHERFLAIPNDDNS